MYIIAPSVKLRGVNPNAIIYIIWAIANMHIPAVKQLGHTNKASPIQLNTNPVSIRLEKVYLQKNISVLEALKERKFNPIYFVRIGKRHSCERSVFTYSLDKLIPCNKMKTMRLIIGKHLKHAVNRDGCSASITKYTDTLLKNGTNFGPTLLIWKMQKITLFLLR